MPNSSASAQTNSGIINALAAYFMWGLAPMYFKALTAVGATEILIHRVVWSTLLLLVIVVAIRKWQPFINTITNKKVVASLAVTATLLGSNWYIFIWAVNNDHLLDASLGYYINPIFNVALGMIFLGERLRKWQGVAVALAIVGVLIQVAVLGTIPVISLVLAATFGIYGLVRKKLHVDSFVGLLIESLLLLPVALLGWLFFVSSDTSNMANNAWTLNTMLVLAGVVTTAPLLCFTAAAKRLTLASLGFFQYIGPSIMFMLATFYYQETLEPAKLATFACIWLALLVYSADSLRARKASKAVSG
ncbi:EamA family transporter RarD [Thalassotalea euphylliae]|uniref:EamA family transporter RarD n=1 Tax=Thalassotalea euphylliae TaxID=1655234 RepID=A0A3E0UJU8_9GAMM|nr:EamA family transporter RarD [Thalassotalea euphylliae]REL37166.1 EamA family transporter RarD [Thalassotalea euphylliae]